MWFGWTEFATIKKKFRLAFVILSHKPVGNLVASFTDSGTISRELLKKLDQR